jgi:hypothetical protein
MLQSITTNTTNSDPKQQQSPIKKTPRMSTLWQETKKTEHVCQTALACLSRLGDSVDVDSFNFLPFQLQLTLTVTEDALILLV